MIKGNRGEWSEIYALIKLLSDGNLIPGDENLEKLENLIYPIISILRKESDGLWNYQIKNKLIFISGTKEISIPIEKFKKEAEFLLTEIKKKRKGTFAIPETEKFLNEIGCKRLKASSKTKSDITIIIHDHFTGLNPILDFSIKSKLGAPSTLLNAGLSTNFIYEIKGNITQSLKNKINSKKNFIDKCDLLRINRMKMYYSDLESIIFKNNLILIDSLLPEILAYILIEYYSKAKSKVEDICAQINTINPLKFDVSLNHGYYEYKIKKFLTDIALGMMPAKVWNGDYEATGGYLVVKEDGEVICYHIYNKKEFEDYLYHNTRLETGSTTRHQFGKIYKEGNKYFIKLNLQIRFL